MDIMTYHYKIEKSSVTEILEYIDSGEFAKNVNLEDTQSWEFTPRKLSDKDSVALALWMFQDLGIIGLIYISIIFLIIYLY